MSTPLNYVGADPRSIAWESKYSQLIESTMRNIGTNLVSSGGAPIDLKEYQIPGSIDYNADNSWVVTFLAFRAFNDAYVPLYPIVRRWHTRNGADGMPVLVEGAGASQPNPFDYAATKDNTGGATSTAPGTEARAITLTAAEATAVASTTQLMQSAPAAATLLTVGDTDPSHVFPFVIDSKYTSNTHGNPTIAEWTAYSDPKNASPWEHWANLSAEAQAFLLANGFIDPSLVKAPTVNTTLTTTVTPTLTTSIVAVPDELHPLSDTGDKGTFTDNPVLTNTPITSTSPPPAKQPVRPAASRGDVTNGGSQAASRTGNAGVDHTKLALWFLIGLATVVALKGGH